MLAPRGPRRRQRPVPATLLALLALATTALSAVAPPSRPVAEPPVAAWATLLRNDRYTFVKSRVRTTYAHPDDHVHHPLNRSMHASDHHRLPTGLRLLLQNDRDPQVLRQSRVRRDDVDIRSASRQQVYQGDPGNSQFIIHVFNAPNGLNLDRVMAKVITVMQDAWSSPVPVRMKVNFADLGEPTVLANGGGTYYVRMPDKMDTLLPVAAAEVIRGKDLNSGEQGDGSFDVLVTLNSGTPWHDGTVGTPPSDKYDLITVILHEVYHNIVFAGSVVVNVTRDASYPGGVRQTAQLFRDYRTRYDAFLANKDGCAILSYLEDEELARQLERTTNEVLGEALVNNEVYFGHGRDQRIARLYAPRVFKPKSSVYHLDVSTDSADSLMAPTIRRGTSQHNIGPTILSIQAIILNINIDGANKKCRRPLANPIAVAPITDGDFEDDDSHDGTRDNDDDFVILPVDDGRRRIGGLPVWAFALIIVFAILLALLLLGLCLALCLRRRKKRSIIPSTHYPTSRTGSTINGGSGRTGTSRSSRTGYIPGMGGRVSSKSSSRYSRHHDKTSHHTTEHHDTKYTTSRRTSSKKSTPPTSTTGRKDVSEKTDRSKGETCRFSGKMKIYCTCRKCCKDSTTDSCRVPMPPPPVASVHTFDPDSVPTHSHKRHHHHRKHRSHKKRCHHECHCCHCCNYKPESARSSSKCKKSKSRAPPPSTRPPTTARDTSTSYTCSCGASTSKASSSKCKCKSVSRCPPSTKPPTTRCPPSTKPPTSRGATTKASSSKCPPCPPPVCPPTTTRACKSGKGGPCGSCNRCTNVVEINVMRC